MGVATLAMPVGACQGENCPELPGIHMLATRSGWIASHIQQASRLPRSILDLGSRLKQDWTPTLIMVITTRVHYYADHMEMKMDRRRAPLGAFALRPILSRLKIAGVERGGGKHWRMRHVRSACKQP
ncbi:hypothetical protein IF2G_04903 [Cordyceps javanica]|nr:hypothetical protein IF2G_04903 [Cordyceps javanica]